jgi:hypothetical protein
VSDTEQKPSALVREKESFPDLKIDFQSVVYTVPEVKTVASVTTLPVVYVAPRVEPPPELPYPAVDPPVVQDDDAQRLLLYWLRHGPKEHPLDVVLMPDDDAPVVTPFRRRIQGGWPDGRRRMIRLRQ